jgi:dCMP deaminase
MKDKFKKVFMNVAEEFANLSHATRAKVGAIIVKDNRIISIGYNGMPAGWENVCEYEIPEEMDIDSRTIIPARLSTRPEVLHAETNAIAKIARSNESSEGAAIFCTHMPCLDCAKLIHQSGINTVYYRNDYHAANGVGAFFLIASNILLERVDK